MRKVIYISDFDLAGSGYQNIAVALCTQLASRGYDVLALGLGYNRQPHDYPFTIVPAESPSQILSMLQRLAYQNVAFEAVIVALDIPLQQQLLKQLQAPNDQIPYIGLFPLESGPLCQTWALSLMRMDLRLVMSEFAKEELAKMGVEAEHIPIGIDCESWQPPSAEERERLREGLGLGNEFIVLTVADNQERKNLSRSMEIFADFSKDIEARYLLVTRPDSPVGWRLEDYAMELGIYDKVMIWQRGMPFKQLWSLFAIADCFLLTSKAEGLAMPILEAMAMGLPCVGTECAAIEEHLRDERGLLIESDYILVDPWGNSLRYMASREDGVYKLKLLYAGMDETDRAKVVDEARQYVLEREWSKAGDVLIRAVEEMRRVKPVADKIEPVGVVR